MELLLTTEPPYVLTLIKKKAYQAGIVLVGYQSIYLDLPPPPSEKKFTLDYPLPGIFFGSANAL